MILTISDHHYSLLTDIAAGHLGLVNARMISHSGGKFLRPVDALGTILCEAWLVDPDRVGRVLSEYMRGLRKECEKLDITPPAFQAVIESLPRAIIPNRFPDVDVKALLRRAAREIPDF